VLGNHDLHLLAVYYGAQELKPKDTFQAVLDAADAAQLCDHLRQQRLFYLDQQHNRVLVHAGIPPMWSLPQAVNYASEVSTALQSENFLDFLNNMYGDTPDCWSEELSASERLRLITNYFTRMRFCDPNGCLELTVKNKSAALAPTGYQAWFSFDNPGLNDQQIIFGHWAALEGKVQQENFIALDTGCVWGGSLTAYCLETGRYYQV